ncbi:6-carboxytetrahydropterin synthase [Rhizobiales bacterium RZME27]|jgi:6-pyruvoyl-tetrahydropterin synthase|uniref:6-carboxy-5,6,7,8-tetrahydropterin synthase n=1 Tax=Endobacterium cereale TaxID=2663029 RepID=A0A6A8ACL9_9HYPH|nr:6-carboxytetrahydropterin synthase [Endobacterium cereale]MEB2847214.1 6-carboxytetrahydropterin synthase [Endobacterium cereale]MQY49063.1 6-carboxytetrahydropterin synthase [Endobacterium cereale]
MFAVEVRDHMMIAHSLPRPVFGPAQAMHGATFVVDAAFMTEDLDEDGLGVDIGLATKVLGETVAPLNYKNLDELDVFRGKVTTTEVLAKHVFDTLRNRIKNGDLGVGGSRIKRLKITLHESHVARAWYEAAV